MLRRNIPGVMVMIFGILTVVVSVHNNGKESMTGIVGAALMCASGLWALLVSLVELRNNGGHPPSRPA